MCSQSATWLPKVMTAPMHNITWPTCASNLRHGYQKPWKFLSIFSPERHMFPICNMVTKSFGSSYAYPKFFQSDTHILNILRLYFKTTFTTNITFKLLKIYSKSYLTIVEWVKECIWNVNCTATVQMFCHKSVHRWLIQPFTTKKWIYKT